VTVYATVQLTVAIFWLNFLILWQLSELSQCFGFIFHINNIRIIFFLSSPNISQTLLPPGIANPPPNRKYEPQTPPPNRKCEPQTPPLIPNRRTSNPFVVLLRSILQYLWRSSSIPPLFSFNHLLSPRYLSVVSLHWSIAFLLFIFSLLFCC
jgi:hypothetical protein